MKSTKISLKSAIALLLALALALGLAACGSADIPRNHDDAGTAAGTAIDIPSPDAKAGAFTDVPDWCREAADWAAGEGIASGYGGGKFGPEDNCTTAQILTFLWRAAGEPRAAKTFPGKTESYYRKAMDWAYSNGMVASTADASAPCNRANAMKYIWQANGSPSAVITGSFSDVSVNASYATAVSWAVSKGIAAGTGDGKFSPAQICTRGHIVTFLYRTYASGTSNSGNANASANSSAAEQALAKYGDIQTLVKSVSKPTEADADAKATTSYGTVDWSTAAQGYIKFTASGTERIFVLQGPEGTQAIFDVAKSESIKVALMDGTGSYQYVIGHNTADKTAYYTDYKNSFTVSKIDSDLAPYLVSTPWGDYANAPNTTAKAAELYDGNKTRLENIQTMAEYVSNLKYDKSLKQGDLATYVNPDTVITNGGGVCAEMSTLLTAMLRSQGIPAYIQNGTGPSGGAHVWVKAWIELSSETKNGTTYSKGAWVLVEATNGTVPNKNSAAGSYTPNQYAN